MLFLVAISVGVKANKVNIPLLLANPIGLTICGLLSAAIFLTVRNDWVKLEKPLTVALPVSFFLPVFDIAIGESILPLNPNCKPVITCLIQSDQDLTWPC